MTDANPEENNESAAFESYWRGFIALYAFMVDGHQTASKPTNRPNWRKPCCPRLPLSPLVLSQICNRFTTRPTDPSRPIANLSPPPGAATPGLTARLSGS